MSATPSPQPEHPGTSPASDELGRRLKPMTAGILRQALQLYRARDPDFVGEYFPNVIARGYSAYDDVFSMDLRQAEALVPILEDSVRYFRTRAAKDQNRNVDLLTRKPLDPDFESINEVKAKAWFGALKDLRPVYRIGNGE